MEIRGKFKRSQKNKKIIFGVILLIVAAVMYSSARGETTQNCPTSMLCTIYERVLVGESTYQTLTVTSSIFALSGVLVIGLSSGCSFKKTSEQNNN